MGAPHKIKTDVKWITDASGNVVGYQNELGKLIRIPSFVVDEQSDKALGFSDKGSLISGLSSPHPRNWFHGWAPGQSTDSNVFRDMVSGNDGIFGADLSKANAWANKLKGYVSTVDPASGVTESVIRIPGPNYDYNGGQSLLLVWIGQATPEGSDTHLMGSSNSSSTGGMAVRLLSSGRLAFVLYGGGNSRYSSTTTDNAAGKPFVASELHQFAIFVNGQTKQQSMWVDTDINVDSATLSSGDPVDTLSSNTWNIGTATPSGGTVGAAVNTLSFSAYKFLSSDKLPSTAQITAAIKAHYRDPSKPISAGAL